MATPALPPFTRTMALMNRMATPNGTLCGRLGIGPRLLCRMAISALMLTALSCPAAFAASPADIKKGTEDTAEKTDTTSPPAMAGSTAPADTRAGKGDGTGDGTIDKEGKAQQMNTSPPVSVVTTGDETGGPQPPAMCLALDAHGVLYLADERTGTVRCITRDGESTVLVRGLRSPSAVAVDHRRWLMVGTRYGEVWRITPNGEAALLRSGLPAVLSLTIDRDGAALIATPGAKVIRVPAD